MTAWRSLVFCTLALASSALPQNSTPQPAIGLVTFYSTGSFLKSAVPGYKYGAFAGLIFDGKQQLAFLRPGHFITFRFAPGPHVFTTNSWLIRTPTGGAHIDLDIKPNNHYYVGTYFDKTLLVVSTPGIEEAPCEDAQKDATKAKPMATKHIAKDVLSQAVAEISFPQCSK